MRTQLVKGSVIEIFQDLITKLKSEGKAKLIKQISYDPQAERWNVKFEGDTETVVRIIFP